MNFYAQLLAVETANNAIAYRAAGLDPGLSAAQLRKNARRS